MGVAVAFVVWIAERKERRAMFAPAPCKYCDLWVRVKGDHWIHENGQKYMPFSGLRTRIMHPASPKALWWGS